MITEQLSLCSIFRECPTPKSVKSCVSRKERYVRGSFTRTGSCKITWTNFGKILSRNGANMDEFNDNEIARLLRLKRYEQPPPDYFENFLHEFHRRKRDELLRESLWSICVDRVRDFVFRHNLRPLAGYSAAVAVIVCAAAISITIYQQPDTAQLAVQGSPVPGTSVKAKNELHVVSPVFIPAFDIEPTLLP